MKQKSRQQDANLDQAVKDVVIGVLGCRCPAEVFKWIEYEDPVDGLNSLLVLIGGRLMVRFLEPGPSMACSALGSSRLIDAVKEGKSERDRRGFNRFRLVLIAPDDDTTARTFVKMTNKELKELDDGRVHVHTMSVDAIPSALRKRLLG